MWKDGEGYDKGNELPCQGRDPEPNNRLSLAYPSEHQLEVKQLRYPLSHDEFQRLKFTTSARRGQLTVTFGNSMMQGGIASNIRRVEWSAILN